MSWNTRIVGSAMVDPSILCPNPKNWRRHPKYQREAMTNVFNEIGWIQDIIVNKTTGNIIDGHMRAELAVKNKEKLVPVKYVELSDDEERQALITYDPLSALAEQDNEMVKQLLGDISNNIDMSKFDFGKDVMNSMLPYTDEELDDIPLVPDTPTTKFGDIIQLGRHRLMCGDSTSKEDVGRLMDGKKADLLITDPPYGVSYASKNKFLNTLGKGNRVQTEIENDHKTPEEMSAFWLAALTAIREHMRQGASYYVTGPQGGDLLLLLLALKDSGFPLRHMLIWAKNNHVLGRSDYHYKHEPILYGWVDGAHTFYGGHSQNSLWLIDKPHKSDLHPTMKPVALFAKAIENSTKYGETIIDTFLGSGTTLIACEQLSRICYGMEISPQYCDVIVNRWEKLTGKKAKLVGEVGE